MPLAPKVVIPRVSSKKRQIADALLEQIRSGELPVGARIPSAPELAETWQVAYGTMHAALTELTRDGWLVRYPKFGTFVAAPAPGGAAGAMTRTALIVLPPRADIVASGNGAEVFAMLHGLSEGAAEHGWHVRVETLPTAPQVSEMESVVARMREASGAVFVGVQYRMLVRRLAETGFPVVSLGDDPGVGDVASYERACAVDLGATHLCRLGRRRITYVGDLRDPQGKYAAFQQTLQREGVAEDPALHIHCPTRPDAFQALEQKLAEGWRWGCDAIYTVNYQIGHFLIGRAREMGLRVPEQIAVVANGIEGNEMTSLPLTYVRLPYVEFGREAARLLANNHGKPPNRKREVCRVAPQLIIRKSCGASL